MSTCEAKSEGMTLEVTDVYAHEKFHHTQPGWGESSFLASDRHEELYDQDVAREKSSQVSPIPKLEGKMEDVSTDCKRQTVEGREDYHDQKTESEVKQNLTSYSRTVRIIDGNTSKSAILDDDRRINESADGVALSLSSVNLGSEVSPSEPDVPQDSGTADNDLRYQAGAMKRGLRGNSRERSASDVTGGDPFRYAEKVWKTSRYECDISNDMMEKTLELRVDKNLVRVERFKVQTRSEAHFTARGKRWTARTVERRSELMWL
ncbi:hypothetical protein C8R48DRAFT_680145 [Suillus tomentosus]|nr:hypothetical protein C8R48DRAFT_680145 [Suillus tomentosus]